MLTGLARGPPLSAAVGGSKFPRSTYITRPRGRALNSCPSRIRVQVIKPVGKPISLAYGLTQFKEYNPLIYRLLNPVVSLLPDSLQNRPIPFRMGDQLAVATRR